MAEPEEDYYTTGQAAKILKVSDRGVRKMIDRGELEDVPDERGRPRIPQREVHRLLQERRRLAEQLEQARTGAPGAEPRRGFWSRLFGE